MRDIRIVFMGTPDFALGVLQKLVEEERNIVGVITSPDKPAGRGRKLRQSAVKEYALSQDLKILQPKNLKEESFLEELKGLHANLQIVVAFRMLPKVLWDLPEYGTFNLHASLLPQYRGAAPINWAIMNGEKKTGVTTFFIDEKIDTGAIILNKEINIEKKETVGTLHDKLMKVGSQLVIETVSLIENENVLTVKQDKKDDTLEEAPKLTSDNTKIDWSQTSKKIDCFIRGLNPYPAAWTSILNNEVELNIKIYDCDFEKADHNELPGSLNISKKELKIASLNGWINIKELKVPGKRKMDVKSLLNGFSFAQDAKVL
ncbi:MAG: methionyl-tRNA formyltransferase [Flavobacteriaceae bacterium]|jgi:methionyl-tRNA formyltransferase|uniref:methionyl-tRNA formyltransferase n=1 Tax=Candidatus Marifrigoribacter sp. Uisw_064 TaxID=3230970 RepID=UPI003ADF68BB